MSRLIEMGSAAEIDGPQFARSGTQIAGRLRPEELPRLAELGCVGVSAGGKPGVTYRIEGGLNQRGKLALAIDMEGSGEMACQRCLEPVSVDLSGSVELELSESVTEIAQADDDIDRVLAGPAMRVAGLVEDELILKLPMVPKHEECAAAVQDEATKGAQPAASSPFSVLQQLKKGGKRE